MIEESSAIEFGIFELVTDHMLQQVAWQAQTIGDEARVIKSSGKVALTVLALLKRTRLMPDGHFDPERLIDLRDLEQFVEFTLANKQQIETQTDLDVRSDIREKPTQMLGAILRLAGLRLKRTTTIKIGGRKIYRYRLDDARLRLMQEVRARRKRRQGLELSSRAVRVAGRGRPWTSQTTGGTRPPRSEWGQPTDFCNQPFFFESVIPGAKVYGPKSLSRGGRSRRPAMKRRRAASAALVLAKQGGEDDALDWSRAKKSKPTEDSMAWALLKSFRPQGPSKAQQRAIGEQAVRRI